MKVKNCPFCGGRPYLEASQRGFVNGEPTKVCYIRCRNCNARSPRVNVKDFGHTSRSTEAMKTVIELWNRRVGFESEYEIPLNRYENEQRLAASDSQ